MKFPGSLFWLERQGCPGEGNFNDPVQRGQDHGLQCLISREKEIKMAIKGWKRLGGSLNAKRQEKKWTVQKLVSNLCLGRWPIPLTGHLHLILTFQVQKFPLIDSSKDDPTCNILFKLMKFTESSFIDINLVVLILSG